MPIYKIQAGRIITVESSTWVGPTGTIWYDEELGDLRLGDGITPGGRLLQLGGSGGGVLIAGSVTDSNSLNAGYTGDTGDGFIAEDTGDLWVWNGSSWINAGTVQGPRGYTGSVGYTGSAGVDGITGYTGSQGNIGYTGSAGLSAYEIAVNNGFVGTEQEWLDSFGGGSTSYTTSIGDDVESIAVGGASSLPASIWKSKNIVEVLDTILFPDVAPTYTIPTFSVSGTQSGTKEIGSSITQSLSLTAVENDAGAFTLLTLNRGATQLISSSNPNGTLTTAIAAQFSYASPNNPNYSYSLTTSDAVTVINGNISWTGSGTYNTGQAKKNNKGVTDTRSAAVRSTNAPQASSSISDSTITVTGIYPYFWGKSSSQPTATSIANAIAEGTANKVLSAASGTLTITYNAAGEYIWVAHMSSYATKTKWYNTELNQGSIGSGNFILSPVTQLVDSPDEYWSNVSFKIYISDGATNTSGALQFRNS